MGQISLVDNGEYYIDYSRQIRKSIMLYRLKDSVATPVVYFIKPKWIKQEDFENFIKSLSIKVNLK